MTKYTIYIIIPGKGIVSEMAELRQSFKCQKCGLFILDGKPYKGIDKGHNHKSVCQGCAMHYPWYKLESPEGDTLVDYPSWPMYWIVKR